MSVTEPGAGAAIVLRNRELFVGHTGNALAGPLELEVRSGEFWAVVGRNGSGKSTWLRTLLGLLPPVSGRVEWGVPRPSPIHVSQESRFDAIHPLTVGAVVAMGGVRGLRRSGIALDPTRALERVGLAELEYRLFRELSVGQRQQVLLARAWASARELVVLDEPTSAMDDEAEQQAFELMAELARERGVALLVVGHDHALLARYAQRAIHFDRSRKRASVGTARDLLAARASRDQSASLRQDGDDAGSR